MREVIDLDDRAGMLVVDDDDEKGRATARTARRRRDSLGFSFLAFDGRSSNKLWYCQALHDDEEEGEEECLPNETEIRTR